MASEPDDLFQQILEQLVQFNDARNADRKADTILFLSLITLLIDAKLLSAQQVFERIDLVQPTLPDSYQDYAVVTRLGFLREWLRGQTHLV
jgi:hypothetical protein